MPSIPCLVEIAMLATGLAVIPSARADCSLDDIRSLDRALNEAIVAHDVAKARALYADAFVLTASGGARKHVEDMLRDIADDTITFTDNTTRDVAVIGNRTTAVLTASLHQGGVHAGGRFDADLLVTDTWTCESDRWRLLAGHASRSAADPTASRP